MITRSVGASPRYWYDISNAPVRATLGLFVWLSGRRWAIEPGCEASTSELGLDHYEGRPLGGWHHHRLVTMLAHFFLWRFNRGLEKKRIGFDRPPGTVSVGSGAAHAVLDERGALGVGGLGAETQSPGLLLASQTASSHAGGI
jgi:hypothetical protein